MLVGKPQHPRRTPGQRSWCLPVRPGIEPPCGHDAAAREASGSARSVARHEALQALQIARVTGSPEAAAKALEEKANSLRPSGRDETINSITSVRLADHPFAIAGTEQGDLELWDVSTGVLARRLPAQAPEPMEAVTAIRGARGLLVFGGSRDGCLHAWEPAEGPPRTPHPGSVPFLCWWGSGPSCGARLLDLTWTGFPAGIIAE